MSWTSGYVNFPDYETYKVTSYYKNYHNELELSIEELSCNDWELVIDNIETHCDKNGRVKYKEIEYPTTRELIKKD